MRQRLYTRDKLDTPFVCVRVQLLHLRFRIPSAKIPEHRLAVHLVRILGVQHQRIIADHRKMTNELFHRFHVPHGVARTVYHQAYVLKRLPFFDLVVPVRTVRFQNKRGARNIPFVRVFHAYVSVRKADFQAAVRRDELRFDGKYEIYFPFDLIKHLFHKPL